MRKILTYNRLSKCRHAYPDHYASEISALGALRNLESYAVVAELQWHLIDINSAGIEDPAALLRNRMNIGFASPERTSIGVIHSDLKLCIRNVHCREVADAIGFSKNSISSIDTDEDEDSKGDQTVAACN